MSCDLRLEIKNISCFYNKLKAVDQVSLSVKPGQITCLLGPSGCGKSTTLRIIAGVETPQNGEICVDGQVICNSKLNMPPERRSIGLMFQDFALFPHLSVRENVAFGLQGNKSDQTQRIKELLSKVSMLDYIHAYPHELSGGEQQRVALARALAPKPKIMLMDEPFSGLDDRLRDDVRDETLEILRSEGTAVLMVTHEPAEAMRMADEIALMRNGRIVQQGAPYNIYNAPIDKDSAAFFSDINVITGKVQGSLIQTAFGQFLAPGIADNNLVDIVIRPQHLRLDFDRHGHGPKPTEKEGTAARAVVVRARFLGAHSLVELRMEYDNSILKAQIPNVFLPKPGTPLWIMIRRDRCFVFAHTPNSA